MILPEMPKEFAFISQILKQPTKLNANAEDLTCLLKAEVEKPNHQQDGSHLSVSQLLSWAIQARAPGL